MKTATPSLVRSLSTLTGVDEYLREHMDTVPFDAFEHILDFHFAHEEDVSARLEARDFIFLASRLRSLAEEKLEQLPSDITRHDLLRSALEEKALRIIILRHLAHQATSYK